MTVSADLAANGGGLAGEHDPGGSPDSPLDQRAEFRGLLGRRVLRALGGLLALALGLGLLGMVYEDELVVFAGVVLDTFGLPALVLLVFITDAIISPVPPQVVLAVLANSPHSAHWVPLVSGLALLSSLAGTTGYWMATRFGHTRLGRLMVGRTRDENRALLDRWGALGAVLCALSPIPYSVTCWAAGTLHVRFGAFVWIPILRFPRFLLYYVAIAFTDDLLRALWPS
ncbi:MAG: hypothetical protein JW751_03160 [Polyangiaceae bacterium]|nr:hypothetical protein [Polyangiaceae bacterium]